jgi:hypothetical protein
LKFATEHPEEITTLKQCDQESLSEKNNLENKTVVDKKGLDITAGCFGWALLHNLYFFLAIGAFVYSLNTSSIILAILPFLIGLMVVIITKRMWIGVGMAIAILISAFIWISFGTPLLLAFLLPFPVGGFIFGFN